VDPVPDPLLLRKSGSSGNRTRTSGSVARNSDHRPQRRSPSLCILLFSIKLFPPDIFKFISQIIIGSIMSKWPYGSVEVCVCV
jgi:hypothetical protein